MILWQFMNQKKIEFRAPAVPRAWRFSAPVQRVRRVAHMPTFTNPVKRLVGEQDVSPVSRAKTLSPSPSLVRGEKVIRESFGTVLRHESVSSEQYGTLTNRMPYLVSGNPAAPKSTSDSRIDEVLKIVRTSQEMLRGWTRQTGRAVPRGWDYAAWSSGMRGYARTLGVVI